MTSLICLAGKINGFRLAALAIFQGQIAAVVVWEVVPRQFNFSKTS